MKIQRSIVVAAAAEKIWPFLVEPERISKWCITIRKLRHTSGQRSGLRTPFYFEERAVGRLMKLNCVITEWVVNERVAFKMTSGNLVRGYEQRYTIEATPSGSRVTCAEDIMLPFGIVGSLAGLFRRYVSEAHLEHMLVKLKGLAEA